MVVVGSQKETLDPGFVLLDTHQQSVPVILEELVLLQEVGGSPDNPVLKVADEKPRNIMNSYNSASVFVLALFEF
ncbi:unnamed protein product [Schistosoma margrebowiei]|uniref:Uncharacterized protein n=1 Tax=Schistosoma margrebowiei TaxID=48269 RepID=A0A183MPP4_9TREM|nr:unnamed protein product [Schistosoma margrebowiei]